LILFFDPLAPPLAPHPANAGTCATLGQRPGLLMLSPILKARNLELTNGGRLSAGIVPQSVGYPKRFGNEIVAPDPM
jgi:hypothetical protein